MTKEQLASGTIHKMPADLRKALLSKAKTHAVWESLTPLARNEWICWVENAKLLDTRKRRVERTRDELAEGKRRPCCWIGCIHRPDKPVSPSVRAMLDKQSKSK